MKRPIFSYLMIAALIFVTGCKDDETKKVSVTGVTVSPTSLTLTIGDPPQQVTATVAPTDATDKSVTWDSDTKTVATVDAEGKVTAVAQGTAKIIVTTKDGGKTAECTVTVNTATVAVTGVTVSPTSLTLTVGDTESLTESVAPENATDKSVTWESDDDSVAEVDDEGNVTAKAAGTAIITVTTNNGGKTAQCTITVEEAGIPVESVTLSYNTLRLYEPSHTVGVTGQLTATVLPEDAANKTVKWSSDNAAVASVDQTTGLITTHATGTALITVTTNNGSKTASCVVTVSAAPTAGNFQNASDTYLVNYAAPTAKDCDAFSHNSGRWCAVTGWTANEAVAANGNVDRDRCFNSNTTCDCLTVTTWNTTTAVSSITNGKLYQTPVLEAGIYRFVAVVQSVKLSDDDIETARFYVVATLGDDLPDEADINSSLEKVIIPDLTAGNTPFTIEFTVHNKGPVSVGFLANGFNGRMEVSFRYVNLNENR